ncbi:MAG: Hsp20/alpha crystallin family protein [Archaeoglobaceae archaeon]
MKKWMDPFDEIRRLQDRIDDLMGEIKSGDKGSIVPEITQFPADVIDEGDKIRVTAELPGFNKADIDVSIEDSQLDIYAKKEEKEEQKEKDFIRRERKFGEVRRKVPLPSDVKEEEIKATYNNGVLEVTMPKAEAAKKTSIKVE